MGPAGRICPNHQSASTLRRELERLNNRFLSQTLDSLLEIIHGIDIQNRPEACAAPRNAHIALSRYRGGETLPYSFL